MSIFLVDFDILMHFIPASPSKFMSMKAVQSSPGLRESSDIWVTYL